MTTESDAPKAAIYCRISLASVGDTTKTDDQERICRELAARLGWEVSGVYTDHARSAWQPNRKRRQWDRMLADVEAGKITAIVVYHGDRLLRTHEDLLALISLSRTRGIKLASPAGTRDLSNYDDQFILEIEASMAKRESASTSRRRKAQYERWRREGKVRTGGGGGRAFGFESDGITHRPDEAAIIRDAAAQIIAGQSVRSVLAAINASGVTSTAGNVIRQGPFQRTLTLPRMAGLMPDGVSAAAWEPILDRATWETLRAVTGMRAPNGGAGKGARYLLSGIARCGNPDCGHVLWAAYAVSEASYRCPPQDGGCGTIRRSRTLLDAYITGRTVGRLNHSKNPDGRAPELPQLAAEFAALTEARAEIEQVMADHTRGRLPALLARLDSVDRRLAELRDLTGDQQRNRLLRQHHGITREEFAALPLRVRRQLVAACFRIEVLPASKRGAGFRPEDVRVTPL